MACKILVPQPGFELAPLSLEAWSLNHGTAREVPRMISFVWNILQEHRGICPAPSHSLRQEPMGLILHPGSRGDNE